MQAHVILSGTRSEQDYLEELFLEGVSFLFDKLGRAEAHAPWPSGQVIIITL